MKNLRTPEPRYSVERCRFYYRVVNDEGTPIAGPFFWKRTAQATSDLYNSHITYGFEMGKRAILEAMRKEMIANKLSQQ